MKRNLEEHFPRTSQLSLCMALKPLEPETEPRAHNLPGEPNCESPRCPLGGEHQKSLQYCGFWTQGFTLGKHVLYHTSHFTSLFCVGYFQDRVSQTICLGWLQTAILLISASSVARITGQHWATDAQLGGDLLSLGNTIIEKGYCIFLSLFKILLNLKKVIKFFK
jgi:hypothetical protein